MTKWEYKVVVWSKDHGFATASALEKVLNEFGQEGWRLATTTTAPVLILMRPLPEAE